MSRLTDLHNNPQVLERWRFKTKFCGLCGRKLPDPPAGCVFCVGRIDDRVKAWRRRKKDPPAVRVQRVNIDALDKEDEPVKVDTCPSCVMGQGVCKISGRIKCRCKCH